MRTITTRAQTVPELAVADLNLSVDGRYLIERLSFELAAGQVLALFGPNGAGKTSLLRAISGVSQTTNCQMTGQIRLAGQLANQWSIDQRARWGVGMVYQHPVSVPTVKLATLRSHLATDLPRELAVKMFEGRGLNDQLSGGEQKRLELAQVAMLRPRLWLIDELDSGVDQHNLDLCGRYLQVHARGATVIVISHSQMIFRYLRPTVAAVLKAGRLVAWGEFATIVNQIRETGYDQF